MSAAAYLEARVFPRTLTIYNLIVLHGFATPGGTRRYVARFPEAMECGFFRPVNDLSLSSVGLGTYLGKRDDETDRGYEEAALVALRSGINVLDTAINYRHQRSERALGAALRTLLNANEIQRDQFLICTKAGFVTPGALPANMSQDAAAGGKHSLDPAFLEDQLGRSRENLGVDTVDVFYLHNPEMQLQFVSHEALEAQLQAAFERCERLVKERHLRWYGTATWNGFRQPNQLDLSRVIDLARYVGGEDHHFRFVQLPFNLAMTEAYQNRDEQGVSALKVAARAGIAVVASATLHQGKLTGELPGVIADRIQNVTGGAAKAIQFTRSTPGISIALVGMKNAVHVRENLEIAGVAPLGIADYEKLYRPIDA